jgi:hypothetical protein
MSRALIPYSSLPINAFIGSLRSQSNTVTGIEIVILIPQYSGSMLATTPDSRKRIKILLGNSLFPVSMIQT